MILKLLLPAALALALSACAEKPPAEPPPGAVEAFAEKIKNDTAIANASAIDAAEARGKARAIAAVERMDASERERLKGR